MNKKSKIIMLIVTNFIIFASTVYGITSVLESKYVSYNNSTSGMSSTNVQDAIDEIYRNVDGQIREYYAYNSEVSCSEMDITEPNLGSDGKLIPVIISDNGTVLYADTSKTWYNYCNKEWANAVYLIDNPSKTYSKDMIIDESDIRAYFVWVPKYKYKLWNVGTTYAPTNFSIDIIFDTTNTIDIDGESCATPMESGASGNCDNGEYMTHPAFISLDVNGFWAGKFETGHVDFQTTAPANTTQMNTYYNKNDASKVIIKPNVISWRYSTVYNMFMTSYNFNQNSGSHMMKNTEWGAVAYLSHSQFGIGKEININNNSLLMTGYSSLLNIQQYTSYGTSGNGPEYNQPYNTSIGYLASTTGNISGIYDMSGGTFEYVASYRGGTVASSEFGNNISNNEYQKYLDIYSSSSGEKTYQYRILGDATGEMAPIFDYKEKNNTTYHENRWYGDSSYFVTSSHAWFHRGGHSTFGVLAGQFSFYSHTGGANADTGFRLVLAP